jgi:hypothetical protein
LGSVIDAKGWLAGEQSESVRDFGIGRSFGFGGSPNSAKTSVSVIELGSIPKVARGRDLAGKEFATHGKRFAMR